MTEKESEENGGTTGKKAGKRLLPVLFLLAACADSRELEALREENERLRAEASSIEVQQTESVTIELTNYSKEMEIIDAHYGKNRRVYHVYFHFAVTNHTEKEIQAVKALLSFADIFGEELYTETFVFEDINLSPDASYNAFFDIEERGELYSPPYDDVDRVNDHVHLDAYAKLKDADSLRLSYQLTAIAYTDGSFERFD